MAVEAQALLKKLDDAYTVYFDRLEVPGDVPHLAARYEFRSKNECYILSRKAVIWSAEKNEHVFVFSSPVLTPEVFGECLERAYADGMACIHPHIDHMSSFITAVFVCGRVEDRARALLEKTRRHKNFMLSLYGWMDLRCAAIDLACGTVSTNRAGRELREFLAGNLARC